MSPGEPDTSLGVSFDEGNRDRAFGTSPQRLQPALLPVVATIADEMNGVTLGGRKILNLKNPTHEVLQSRDTQRSGPAQIQRHLTRPFAERIVVNTGQDGLQIGGTRSGGQGH